MEALVRLQRLPEERRVLSIDPSLERTAETTGIAGTLKRTDELHEALTSERGVYFLSPYIPVTAG